MVQDLKAFLEKINGDQALKERMGKIVKESTQENMFANCNAVAAEMGYTITQEDMKTFADEYQEDLSDEDLDKVAGGISPLLLLASAMMPVMSSCVASAIKIDQAIQEK